MNPEPTEHRRALLRRAVQDAAPTVSPMFEHVRFSSVAKEIGKTNPLPATTVSGPALNRQADSVEPSGPASTSGERSKMFGNARQCSVSQQSCETKPIVEGLSPRQASAARMMMSGQTCRATAAALGVEEHSIYRWKKLPAFAREVDRLQRLLVVESASARRRAR